MLYDRAALSEADLRQFASQEETSPFRFIDPDELPEEPEDGESDNFGQEDNISGTNATVREDDTAGEVRAEDEDASEVKGLFQSVKRLLGITEAINA